MNPGNKLTLVNVGCGDRFHAKWINLDIEARVGVTKCNILKGLPFRDESVDAVYSAAMVEHLSFQSGLAFLVECHRVLKSNGIIRIAVPDFEKQCRVYLECLDRVRNGEPRDSDHDWMILEIIDQFARDESGGEMARFLAKVPPNRDFIVSRIGVEGSDLIDRLCEQPRSSFRAAAASALRRFLLNTPMGKWFQFLRVGKFRLSGEVHRSAYDRYSLGNLLTKAGFACLGFPKHGEGDIPGWQSFHLEQNANGVIFKPDLLIAECRKP